MWRKDEVKGKADEVKGIVKEETGNLVGDERLEEQDIIDLSTDKVKQAAGAAKRHVEDTVNDIKKNVKR